MIRRSALGQLAIRHSLAIAFIALALCIAGMYTALHMPSSVFPQTNFPRVVILVDNGVMPGEEMMAEIDRVSEGQILQLCRELLDLTCLAVTVLGPVSPRAFRGVMD